jgi:tRNA (guanine37-N1)-methyltransferase
MRWTVLTLFPEMFDSVTTGSLFGKAREKGLLQVEVVNFRDFATGRHKVVDDSPFGGGAGMLIKVEPVARALDAVREKDAAVRVILLSPQGAVLTQAVARRLATHSHLALLCGRYEGVDERIRTLVDEELSIGDYVLSGGEPAAWVLMDAVSRLVPGVLGCTDSIREESFSDAGLLEYPQYTRPRSFRGMEVPEVLISGDHAAVARWRRQQAELRTAQRRPDLMARAGLDQKQ